MWFKEETYGHYKQKNHNVESVLINISGKEFIFVCFDCLEKARSVMFEGHQDFLVSLRRF